MPPKSGKMSREEELLLEGFSKNDSTKSSALFYGNAFIVSAIPVWLYWRVHSIDIASYAVIFAIGTLVSTWLLAFAYKNTKHLLKHKVAVKRESAVTKEMNKKLADDKKISKKEKDERILWKKNEVCSCSEEKFSEQDRAGLCAMMQCSFIFIYPIAPCLFRLLSTSPPPSPSSTTTLCSWPWSSSPPSTS